jgi:hypothetical protein
MNCSCLAETAEKLKLKLMEPGMEKLRPKGATGVRHVGGTNMVLRCSDFQAVLNIPFTIHWVGSKKASTEVEVTGGFCPFCGKPAEPEAKEDAS